MVAPIKTPAVPTQANWQRNPKPEIGEDAIGKFVMIQPGNTAGDIALLLERNGQKIPPDLAPYYFSKNDSTRPDPKKHEGNLPVGKKFYLPTEADSAVGAPLPGWLSKAAIKRAPPQLEAPQSTPGEAAEARAPAAAAAAGSAGAAQVGPGLQARIQNEAPGQARNVGSLQSGLIEDLSKLPLGLNDAQRETLATQFVNGLEKNPSISDSAKKQLTFVAKAWAQNPANLDNQHRGDLWTPGQQFSNGSKTLEQALKDVEPRAAATQPPAVGPASSTTPRGEVVAPAEAVPPGTVVPVATTGSPKLDAAKAELKKLTLEARDRSNVTNPEWLSQANKRLLAAEMGLDVRDAASFQADSAFKSFADIPTLKAYRFAHGRNEAIQDGSDFSGNRQAANQFLNELSTLPPRVQRAIVREFPDFMRQMLKGETMGNMTGRAWDLATGKAIAR